MIYYSDKNLFSSSKLWEYDEEGQKFFLAYLMKSEEWHIENNTIVFKDLSSFNIDRKLQEYDDYCKKEMLKHQKQILDYAKITSIEFCENSIERQLENIKEREEQLKKKDEKDKQMKKLGKVR
ncbi:MAG: hypothetical protein ILA02_00135 [Clostridia bacterium]|nr:hypothetical protein [Clostridia bacterium]